MSGVQKVCRDCREEHRTAYYHKYYERQADERRERSRKRYHELHPDARRRGEAIVYTLDQTTMPPTSEFSSLEAWIQAVSDAQSIPLAPLSRLCGVAENTFHYVVHKPERPLMPQTQRRLSEALEVPLAELERLRPSAHAYADRRRKMKDRRWGGKGHVRRRKGIEHRRTITGRTYPGAGKKSHQTMRGNGTRDVWQAKVLLRAQERRDLMLPHRALIAQLHAEGHNATRIRKILEWQGIRGSLEPLRRVMAEMAEMGELGPSPPAALPSRYPTLAQIAEAREIIAKAKAAARAASMAAFSANAERGRALGREAWAQKAHARIDAARHELITREGKEPGVRALVRESGASGHTVLKYLKAHRPSR